MDTLEKFEQHLRDALAHLYEPTYQPSRLVWMVTGCSPHQGIESVQAALIRAIENLKPGDNIPPTARIRRFYELLFYRYVQNLTQEATARHLGITARHLRREQREAVHVLAQRLWERGRAEALLADDLIQEEGIQPPEETPSNAKSPEYRAQVRKELASLQKATPGAVANVGEAIHKAVELGSKLTARHGISLEVEQVEPSLVAPVHFSALRQVLITAIRNTVQRMSSGQVTLCAERQQGRIKITITGHPASVDRPPNSHLIREILAAQDGSVEIGIDGDQLAFQLELPCLDQVTVLVVDDNPDLVHFYRRYTTGTRYQIVCVTEGQRVLGTIEESTPAIIVLDVMLPDIDGWELLAQLREHPATRSIPIIVCSVIREEELALMLGAALYLPKPVRRWQFIKALDRVLSQAPITTSIAQANNAATC